ncbi:MAG: phosphotransferase family protein [Chloroflexi bacterium]|nr:phosphotransferase family protein [Chloroflexota bacterium]
MATLEKRLAAYVASRLPEAQNVRVSNLFRVPGGFSRETWSFDMRYQKGAQETVQGMIMRRDPDGGILEVEYDLGTEFRLYQAVHGSPVPVPKVYWLEKDPAWLERQFYIMGRFDGCESSPQVLVFDPRYESVRQEIARRQVEILARIHNLDWRALGLEFLGVPDSPAHCASREIAKWERVLNEQALEPRPVLRGAIQWLRQHLPAPAQRIGVVHSDYRVGNFLYNQQGEILAVLDWEMVHLGDPMEDLGWVCFPIARFAGDDKVGGLFDRDEFYRLYEEYSGLKVDPTAVRFWEALGLVKLAAIALTGSRSFCDGRTHNIVMGLTGRSFPTRLEMEIMSYLGV